MLQDKLRREEGTMKKILFRLTLLVALLFVLCWSVQAQQAKKVSRVGFLSNTDPARESSRIEGIRRSLRERGYIEGKNIAIEDRYAEGKDGRFPELAAELVRLKVEIIVVSGNRATLAAKNTTKTIPIVMVGLGSDPVKAGLIESLARPGGNVTGLTNLSRELVGKQLELFKEAFPKLARVAVLSRSGHSGHDTGGERGPPSSSTCVGVDCPVLGSTECGRFRASIRCAKQGAPGWTLCARQRPANAS